MSFGLDAFVKKYSWAFTLLSIALCASFLGRAAASVLTATLLSGEGPQASRRAPSRSLSTEPDRGKDIEYVLRRNIFCSTCAPISLTPDKVEAAATGPVDSTPVRSNLNLTLLATMVAPGDPMWSMAIIRDNGDDKKPVNIYRRGDNLPQGSARLAQVVDGRAYLLVGRRIEYLDQGQGPPPPPPSSTVIAAEPMPGDPTGLEKDVEKGVRCTGASCEVDKSLIDKILSNTTALATSARFVPSIKDGKPNGFKLYAIRPGSVFAKIGLQNADLIKGINGLDMSTPDRALEAYTKLKSASHLTVNVERRGENVTLDYQIR
ncbi:MAG TPA: type II secretion system protein GspC [Pseudomonadota bacterium]|nr:type II secretion system protein GspC [Pseudomonadota bacterium]